ncbi:MAG: hypothetical protein PF542_04910 [Nanoarchaeota archaeon]|nr:hypothetical protein [Nanoarchaeota archaeon]
MVLGDMMINKKAQGMSTNTIILLVLGLLVLAALVFGFATGWSTFKNIVSPTNVDAVVEDCSTACALANTYSFCNADRTLRVNEEKLDIKTSCAVMATSPNFTKYRVATCEIDCMQPCEDIKITDKKGTKAGIVDGKGSYYVSALSNNGACFI